LLGHEKHTFSQIIIYTLQRACLLTNATCVGILSC